MSTNELYNELKEINPRAIKNDPFQDTLLDCYVYKVYDTDTINVLFKHNDIIYKKRIRLSGLDSPEKFSKVPEERALCKQGTEYLSEMILNKMIRIKTDKSDKYGRMLGTIYFNDENINEKLISGGYAQPYDGGKKLPWNLRNRK